MINVGKGDGIFRDKKSGQALWDVEWESSRVQPGDGTAKAELRTVTGKLYTDGKVSTTFEADGARIDQEQKLLVLKGKVKLTSLGAPGTISADGEVKEAIPSGVLTCDQVRYEAKVKDKEVVKARGGVVVKTDQGTIGPTPELWANAKLTVVATPDLFNTP